MRKVFALLLLAVLALPAFADDALVLPAGVLRLYAVPVYAWASQMYDKDGKAQDLSIVSPKDSVSVFNLGFAAEYGVTDWVSAAVQWTPGWYAWSDITPTGSSAKLNANGVDDIFAGAKIQIVGSKGLVQNESFRFAVAPGVKIPLPDVDWNQQLTNLGSGKDATVTSLAKHAWGLGARGYFDYVINEMFFVNAYTEFIYYLQRTNASFLTFTPAPAVATADINYGYELTFELEPHAQFAITDGIEFGAGLPLTFVTTPNQKVNGSEVADTYTNLLSLRPNVSMFFMKFFIPIEVVAQYTLPLYGKNTYAISIFDVELRTYLKF